MMKALFSLRFFVVSLTILFSGVCLHASELKPVYTLKIASPNYFVALAEKIAETGEAFVEIDPEIAYAHAEFQAGIEFVKMQLESLKGIIDADIDFGFALNMNFDKLSPSAPWAVFEPILLLPISDLRGAINASGRLPNMELAPLIANTLLRRTGETQYIVETPLVSFVVVQTKDGLLVTPLGMAMPENMQNLFQDVDRFDIGEKFDFSGLTVDDLAKMFGIIVSWGLGNFSEGIRLAQDFTGGDPQMRMVTSMVLEILKGDSARQIAEQFSRLPFSIVLKEFKSVYSGLTIDPNTLELEYTFGIVPQKWGDLEKLIDGRKNARTMFSSFRGTPENTVFHLADAQTFHVDHIAIVMPLIERGFTELKMQLEMESQWRPDAKMLLEISDSLQKIVVPSVQSGTFDVAVSLDTNGTILFGAAMSNTGELQKVAQSLFRSVFADINIGMGDSLKVLAFLSKNMRIDESTIEGFRISSLRIPIAEVIAAMPELENNFSPGIQNFELGLLWAIKDNEAIAFAAGLDFAKAEATFKNVLAGTGVKAPLQQPLTALSLAPLGTLLENVVPKIVEDVMSSEDIEMFNRVVAELKKGNDAVVTISEKFIENGGAEYTLRVSEQMIDTLVQLAVLAQVARQGIYGGLLPFPPTTSVPVRGDTAPSDWWSPPDEDRSDWGTGPSDWIPDPGI